MRRGTLYYPPQISKYRKTAQTDLLNVQVAASTDSAGSAFNCSTSIGGIIGVRFAGRAATASTASAKIRLEFSKSTTLDNSWFPFSEIASNFPTREVEAVTGTVAAGATTITVASTTNLVVGGIIYIDNGSAATSEWARIKSLVANTSITVEDPLVNAATGGTIYNGAEIYAGIELPSGALRVRAFADGSLYTQAYAVNVSLTTIDGIG